MRKDIETYELIEQYLNGNLDDKELGRVEKLINSDKEFALEVEKHKKINDFIFDRSMLDIKDQIRNIHEQNLPSSGKNFGRGKLFGFIGGLILTGVVVSYIIISNNDKNIETPIKLKVEEPFENTALTTIEHTAITKEVEPNIYSNTKQETTNQKEQNSSDTKNIKEQPIEELEKEGTKPEAEALVPEDSAEIKDTTAAPEESTGDIQEEESETTSAANEFDCNEVTIEALIESTKSCDNKASGEIQIAENSITGGTPPYQVSIDGGLNFYSLFNFEKLFPKLYPVIIRDKNNCKSELLNQLVGSMDCTYEYNFAPDKGERWEIPTKEKTGNIKIYSNSGQIIFQQVFDFPGTNYWYGRNSAGNDLPMGLYTFVLELDGEDTLIGAVTIIR